MKSQMEKNMENGMASFGPVKGVIGMYKDMSGYIRLRENQLQKNIEN